MKCPKCGEQTERLVYQGADSLRTVCPACRDDIAFAEATAAFSASTKVNFDLWRDVVRRYSTLLSDGESLECKLAAVMAGAQDQIAGLHADNEGLEHKLAAVMAGAAKQGTELRAAQCQIAVLESRVLGAQAANTAELHAWKQRALEAEAIRAEAVREELGGNAVAKALRIQKWRLNALRDAIEATGNKAFISLADVIMNAQPNDG